MILVLSLPITLYIESLTYTTYPLASDAVVQLIATLVVVVLTNDTIGADDGASTRYHNIILKTQYKYLV